MGENCITVEPWFFQSEFPGGVIAGGSLELVRVAPPATAPTSSVPSPAGGKPPKRRSRAAKRSHTTFIAADQANFRRMVQQITGIGSAPAGSRTAALKPLPTRPWRPSPEKGFPPVFFSGSSPAPPPPPPADLPIPFFPTLESWVAMSNH